MFASPRHWRILIAIVVGLLAAAFAAPMVLPAPGIEENRVLAGPLAWPANLREVRSFRTTADTYVADRFPPRAHLIGLLNRLRMLVRVSGSERVIVGRDGYLYWDAGTHLGAARGDPPMEAPAIRRWLWRLAGRTEALQARRIPYLMIVGPTKETVYPQFAPGWFSRPNVQRPAIVVPELAEATGAGHVLYLHEAVADATRRGWKTFSRHDTHWTGYGAYAAYAAVMDKLHAMGVSEGPLPLSRFGIDQHQTTGPRDLALMLGVASTVDVDFPHIVNPAGGAKARTTYLSGKQDWTAPQVVETGEAGKPVLLMTRNSFSQELLPLLFPHFSRIILAHNQDGFWRPDLIDRFKPDVVILEAIEHGLPMAMENGPLPSAVAADRIDGELRSRPSLAALGPRFHPSGGPLLLEMTKARRVDRCSLDQAALEHADDGTLAVSVAGWVFDMTTRRMSPDGFIRLQGQGADLTLPIRMDVSRPDVAAALHDSLAEQSGFQASVVDVRRLLPGPYQLTVYRRSRGGLIVCPSQATITVAAAGDNGR